MIGLRSKQDRLVNKMGKEITRRLFLKRTMGTILTAIGLSSVGYYYANRIEPRLLEITQKQITHPMIPKSFDGIKIVQFSDTHLGFHYDLNQLCTLVNQVNALEPNLIFFTGDLMDEPNKYSRINDVVKLLSRLHAPLGKFCIYGNHDHGGYGSDIYRRLMEKANFKLLLNESWAVKLKEDSLIYIIGIDDAMLGQPDIRSAVKNVPSNYFKLLLSHAPDLADTAWHNQIHWQLSGHSHGGQVKLPFIGALVKPPFAQIYTEGQYTIGGKNPLTLYVNRGIGTTRLPFRFMAKPEITVFTFKS
jgi:predicted MPP superfamily phosphohydrolase